MRRLCRRVRSGGVAVYPSDATNLVIDVNGYFATPGTGGLQLYTVDAVPRAGHAQDNGGAFTGELTVNIAGSPCAPAEHGESIRVQCDSGAVGRPGILDPVAGRGDAAGGIDAECAGWSDHIEHGDRAEQRRQDGCLCQRHDAIDAGYFRLFCAVVVSGRTGVTLWLVPGAAVVLVQEVLGLGFCRAERNHDLSSVKMQSGYKTLSASLGIPTIRKPRIAPLQELRQPFWIGEQ